MPNAWEAKLKPGFYSRFIRTALERINRGFDRNIYHDVGYIIGTKGFKTYYQFTDFSADTAPTKRSDDYIIMRVRRKK